MSVSAQEFRRAAGCFATGVTVVTAEHEGKPCGLTVNAFLSISLEPALVLVSIGRSSRSLPCVENAERFGVSVLAEEQEEVSRVFASKEEDKFTSTRTLKGVTGVPLIEGAIAHLECRTTRRIDVGDHVLFIAEVEVLATRDGAPLIFERGSYRRLEKR